MDTSTFSISNEGCPVISDRGNLPGRLKRLTRTSLSTIRTDVEGRIILTLRLLMSYIYGAPSKARSANVVYIWT